MISVIYLFEATSWKEKSLEGKISYKGLAKLTKAGVRKPVLTYLAGFQKGTDNIRKKAGAVHERNRTDSNNHMKNFHPLSDYETHSKDSYDIFVKPNPNTSTINKNMGKLYTNEPKDFKRRDNVGELNRHEAYEAREIRKQINSGILPKFASKPTIFSHTSPKVLRDEKRDIDMITGIYPHLKNEKMMKELANERKQTDEYNEKKLSLLEKGSQQYLIHGKIMDSIKDQNKARLGTKSVLDITDLDRDSRKYKDIEDQPSYKIPSTKLRRYENTRMDKEYDFFASDPKVERRMKDYL